MGGDRYKLEVEREFYQLQWRMKDSWLTMYRFERNVKTGCPEIADREMTLRMLKELHEGPPIIPIRDVYVKIAVQTHNALVDFRFSNGTYTLKIFSRGKLKHQRDLSVKEFFIEVNKYCRLKFEISEIPIKKTFLRTIGGK